MSGENQKLASRRKLAAKKNNERVKLLATALNALSIATFSASVILPGLAGSQIASAWVWIPIAFGLHLLSHAVIALLKSED